MNWAARLWKTMLTAAPLRMWALFASGPALTLGTAALVLIVKDSSWPEALRGRQLDFLGYAMLGSLALVGVVVITLAAVRVKGKAGIAEIEVGGDSEDTPRAAVVTTTVETKS
jgi:hypothetical protein